MSIDPKTQLAPSNIAPLDPFIANLILDQAQQMMIITDTANRIDWVNRAFVEKTGIPADQAIGRKAADVIPLADDSPVQQAIDAAAQAGVPFAGELPYVIDGKIRWFHVELCPLYSDGELVCSVGFNRDITTTMERANEREQGHRLQAIGSLAAGVAHEINTPVQYVSDNVQFLHESFEEMMRLLTSLVGVIDACPDQSEWKQRAEEADLDFLVQEIPAAIDQSTEGLQRVARIVQGMREFSKTGSGRFDTELNRVISNTLDVTKGEWGYVADLELDLSDEVGTITCNESEIKQVLLNLISNATHALEERHDGRGALSVSTRVAGDLVEIVFADTGVGMSSDVQSNALDPFFTTKAVGRGAGQGLNIARSIIVDRHAGTMNIASEEGVGTTVTIRLPRDNA